MTPRIRHFIRYQLPAILWALVIFAASSIPASRLPKIVLKFNDKLLHASIFLVFGLFVFRAFEPRIKKNVFDWERALFSIAVVTGYGVLDEIHQMYVPGRTPDAWDAAADGLGGVLAALILYLVFRGRYSKGVP